MNMEPHKRNLPEQAASRLNGVKDLVQGMKTKQGQLGSSLPQNMMRINSMKADSTWGKVCSWIVNITRRLNVPIQH